jgi:hypothetical protein
MAKRKVIRMSANIPAIIVEKWEALLERENGYLPFTQTSRIELAILEHIRVLEKRLSEPLPLAGGGGRGMGEAEEQRIRDEQQGRERWHIEA